MKLAEMLRGGALKSKSKLKMIFTLGLLALVFLLSGQAKADNTYWKTYFSTEERKAVQKNAEKYTLSEIESKSEKWKGLIRSFNIKDGTISNDDIKKNGINTDKISGLGDFIDEKISDSSTPQTPQDFSAGNLTGSYAALDGSRITNLNPANISAGTLPALNGSQITNITPTNITGSGNLNIGNGDLFVDDASGNIGIGTTGPGYKLQVSGTLGITGTSDLAGTVAAGGIVDVGGTLNTRANLLVLNKASNDWVTWATRDTSDSEVVYNLSNIGTLSVGKMATFNNQLHQTYTALVSDSFYDGFLSQYTSDFAGYNYHAVRSGSGTGGAIGAANTSTGHGSAIVANRYPGGTGNGVEGTRLGTESGNGVVGTNAGTGEGAGVVGIITGGSSGNAIYGWNYNGTGYAGYFLGANGVRIISGDDLSTGYSFRTGGATTLGLVVKNNGNVGIGTTTPAAALDVNGQVKMQKSSSQPFSCDMTHDATMAVTSAYRTCICKGTSTTWVFTTDGTTACTW